MFPSSAGTALITANVRNRRWMPLRKRAEVRYRDMYSLRWTFVSLARASGEAAFNRSRVIGHARSTIVDTLRGLAGPQPAAWEYPAPRRPSIRRVR